MKATSNSYAEEALSRMDQRQMRRGVANSTDNAFDKFCCLRKQRYREAARRRNGR